MRKLTTVLLILVALGALSLARRSAAQAAKEQSPPLKFKVGDVAPDFTLKDQNGKDVSLHDFKGKKSVALAFYVFAFTGG